MDGFPEYVPDTNGPAYVKREDRTGPPLDYLGEKIEGSLKALHDLVRSITDYVPDGLPVPGQERGNPFSIKQDYLSGPARTAFHYSLVAYLGLYNMLGMAGSDLEEELLAMSHEEFGEWAERIARAGSVNGLA